MDIAYMVCWVNERNQKEWQQVQASQLENFLLENKLVDLQSYRVNSGVSIFPLHSKFDYKLIRKQSISFSGLSERQNQIIQYVDGYMRLHNQMPTLKEIGQAVGLSSRATVHKHLKYIRSRGLLKDYENLLANAMLPIGSTFSVEKTIYEYIKEYQEQHGYPPTVREICEVTGYTSTSTVHKYLKSLEKVGYIEREKGKPRAISI